MFDIRDLLAGVGGCITSEVGCGKTKSFNRIFYKLLLQRNIISDEDLKRGRVLYLSEKEGRNWISDHVSNLWSNTVFNTLLKRSDGYNVLVDCVTELVGMIKETSPTPEEELGFEDKLVRVRGPLDEYSKGRLISFTISSQNTM